MTSAEFLAAFGEIVELPGGTLTGQEKLEDVDGWTSMAMLGLIALADGNGRRVIPRQIAAAETVNDLMALAGAEG